MKVLSGLIAVCSVLAVVFLNGSRAEDVAREGNPLCASICVKYSWASCAGRFGSTYPSNGRNEDPNCSGECWPSWCLDHDDVCESTDEKNFTTVPQVFWMEQIQTYVQPPGEVGWEACSAPSVVCKVRKWCEGCRFYPELGDSWKCQIQSEELSIPRATWVYDANGDPIDMECFIVP